MTLTVRERRPASRRVRGTNGRLPTLEAEEIWIVTSDDGSEDEQDVWNLAALPQYDDEWEGGNSNTDSTLICTEREVTQPTRSKLVWHVRIRYESAELAGGGAKALPGSDPVSWDPTIELDTELETFAPWTDVNEIPIVNRAGDRPENPPPAYRPLLTMRYMHYRQFATASAAAAYATALVTKVNLNPFMGGDDGTWFINRIRATPSFVLGFSRWAVSYDVRWRPEGWRYYIDNKGRTYISALGGVRVTAALDGSNPPVVWLDDSGGVSTTANQVNFQIYGELDFNGIFPGLS